MWASIAWPCSCALLQPWRACARARAARLRAASAWEIGIKNRLGRLDGDPLLAAWTELLADANIGEVTIDSADAITAARLPWEHRDPFDRLIVAQALRRNLTIATRDAQILTAALSPTLTV